MSCSALIGSAPSICARRRRERLAKTLAPVGPQAPPALRSARLVAVAALRAGPSCGLPGRAAAVPTRPLCLRTPVHYLYGRYTRERGEGWGEGLSADASPAIARASSFDTVAQIAAYVGDARNARSRGCGSSTRKSAAIRPGRAVITAIRVER
jgi:hypothetical protein